MQRYFYLLAGSTMTSGVVEKGDLSVVWTTLPSGLVAAEV